MPDIMSFLIPPLMVVEILIADYIFALTFERRSYFWLRYVGYGLGAVLITVWGEIAYSLITEQGYEYGSGVNSMAQSLFNFAFYLVIFIMTILVCAFSYKESFGRVVLCCSGAYAVQHIARNVTSLFMLIPPAGDSVAVEISVTFGVYLLTYALVYFLFARRLRSHETYEGNNVRKITLSLIVILLCIVMSRLTSDNPERNTLAVVAESIYAILSCTVLLICQFGVVENDSMHREVDNMAEILRSERRQYELSRENIALINEKCHDLKQQISALRGNASEENIAEIEHSVMIYDSMVKTGHDVLDVILTEKKLQCESKSIQMTCMIKGELLSFMDNMDVYSLFGNALSNAIESVGKLPDVDKRCISVNVRDMGSMLSVHVENYYEGTVDMRGGLPVTTKADKDWHGYGMASMNRVARKYGGEMTVTASGGKFCLDFLFPRGRKQ